MTGRSTHSDDRRQSRTHYLKTLVVVIVIVALAAVLVPRNNIDVEVGEESLKITGTSGSQLSRSVIATVEVDYDTIIRMDLVETQTYGEMVDGYVGRRLFGPQCDVGIWNWDDFGGNYQIFIREDARCAILMETTSGGCILFNCESTDSTEMFYEALIDYLAERFA